MAQACGVESVSVGQGLVCPRRPVCFGTVSSLVRARFGINLLCQKVSNSAVLVFQLNHVKWTLTTRWPEGTHRLKKTEKKSPKANWQRRLDIGLAGNYFLLLITSGLVTKMVEWEDPCGKILRGLGSGVGFSSIIES